jgi:hypothetical protein
VTTWGAVSLPFFQARHIAEGSDADQSANLVANTAEVACFPSYCWIIWTDVPVFLALEDTNPISRCHHRIEMTKAI